MQKSSKEGLAVYRERKRKKFNQGNSNRKLRRVIFGCDTPSLPDIYNSTKYNQNTSKGMSYGKQNVSFFNSCKHEAKESYHSCMGHTILIRYICLPNVIKISQRV